MSQGITKSQASTELYCLVTVCGSKRINVLCFGCCVAQLLASVSLKIPRQRYAACVYSTTGWLPIKNLW